LWLGHGNRRYIDVAKNANLDLFLELSERTTEVSKPLDHEPIRAAVLLPDPEVLEQAE
jgi:hypothetical protein